MYLSWIIPVYNEERRIEKSIREVALYIESRRFPGGYEIIVSNSGSTDRTSQIVERLRGEFPALRIVTILNKGKGWAVKQGMREAHGDIRLFSDADNSTVPSYFDAMEPLFKEGYDVVISSRDPKDAPGASRDIKEPWYRELLGNVGNLVIQLFGTWGIWDTQNGFKACTARAAEAIFSKTLIQEFSFDIEMLALARRLQYRIGIIPIRWKFDPDSKVTLGVYVKFFLDVFRIRWNLMTNKYNRPTA